jgi:hypothetical protein
MPPRAVVLRWPLLFVTLALFGAVPAGALLIVDGTTEGWPLLEAEARARAALLDCRLQRWQRLAEERATELSALLAQLPEARLDEGRLGTAAEGTLLLYLQRKLAETTEISEYSVLTPKGTVLVSSSGGRGAPALEVGEAERPAAMMTRASSDTRLVVVAPIRRAGRARRSGLVVVVPAPALVTRVLGEGAMVQLSLVDGNGLLIGAGRTAELGRLGSESGVGRARLSSGPATYAPLQSTRAVVVATAPATRRLSRWQLVALGGVLVLAALAARLLTRAR